MRLEPNVPLPIGELSDKIVVKFQDGSECHISLVFSSVGDVYGESSSLAIGRIPASGTLTETFKIHFSRGTKPWATVKWAGRSKGVLCHLLPEDCLAGADLH